MDFQRVVAKCPMNLRVSFSSLLFGFSPLQTLWHRSWQRPLIDPLQHVHRPRSSLRIGVGPFLCAESFFLALFPRRHYTTARPLLETMDGSFLLVV